MTPIHGWEINRLAAALGAEVRGVQLAGADADIAQQVQDLLNEHQVLFFPDQTIDVAQITNGLDQSATIYRAIQLAAEYDRHLG